MEKIKAIWEGMPKTIRVFLYMAVSTIFAEVLIELGALDQTLFVRIFAQMINLGIVFLEEAVPAVKMRLAKK